MSDLINIDIVKFTEERDWKLSGTTTEYTGHMYRGSAFESCDGCGNCNGARCETCKKVVIKSHLECCIECDRLEEYIKSACDGKITDEIISDMVYSDYHKYSYGGYHLIWPTESMLKEQNPELYSLLTTQDEEIFKRANEIRDKKLVTNFGDLQDIMLKENNITERVWDSHLYKQLKLWWVTNGETNDIFK